MPTETSVSASSKHEPELSPDILVSACSDRIHYDKERGRSVTVARINRKGKE